MKNGEEKMSRALAIDPGFFFATHGDISFSESEEGNTWGNRARFTPEAQGRNQTINVRLGNRNFTISLARDISIEILDSLAETFNKILNLRENWDSYGASEIYPENVETAFEIILSSLQRQNVLPEIFPTPLGGIELRWTSPGKEFEIEFNEPGKFEALFCDEENPEGIEIEGNLENIQDKAKAEDYIQQTLA